jgi:hypothetical protein
MNPHGSGWWLQNSDTLTEGDLEILPDTAMDSWTISFWTRPSRTSDEHTLLDLNGGWLQLRRSGTEWDLWRGNTNLAAVDILGSATSHHVALTYQSITGILKFYIDAGLRAQVAMPGAPPATAIAIGGDPGFAARNANGDEFTDILLYRAPLAPTGLQSIRAGQAPWKSVAAWVPLAYASDRPFLNLAASIVTTIVHGTWTWSGAAAPPAPPSPVGRSTWQRD